MHYNVTLRVASTEHIELDDSDLVAWATTSLAGRVLAHAGTTTAATLGRILRSNPSLRQALVAAYLAEHPALMTKGARRDDRRRRIR